MADGDVQDPWDLLQQDLEALPQDGHPVVLKFRFDPGGAVASWKPPLTLRRDEDVETQVARHIEQARLPAGKFQLRLCFLGRPVRQTTVDLPGCSTLAVASEPGPGASLGDKVDPVERLKRRLEARIMQKVEEALSDDEDPEDGDDDEENGDDEEEEAAPPPPDPLWLQAIKSERAQGIAEMLVGHLNTFLEAKAGTAVAERRLAEARAEGVTGEGVRSADAAPVQRVRVPRVVPGGKAG